jgi:hypothetical protein
MWPIWVSIGDQPDPRRRKRGVPYNHDGDFGPGIVSMTERDDRRRTIQMRTARGSIHKGSVPLVIGIWKGRKTRGRWADTNLIVVRRPP